VVADLHGIFDRCFFFRSVADFFQSAKLPPEPDYTDEQVRAGIKEFSKFGALNTIDSMAGSDITRWEQVTRLPMADVVMKMKMNHQQARFDRKYTEIMQKKHKQ